MLRATEWTESLRYLVTTIVETNLTVQVNYMDLTRKKATSWAAIIAVPTAIIGFYGHNLLYRGFGDRSGSSPLTTLILALVGPAVFGLQRQGTGVAEP